MEFKVIINDEQMTKDERQEFADQLRAFVHGEWWSQYSAVVIGGPEGD